MGGGPKQGRRKRRKWLWRQGGRSRKPEKYSRKWRERRKLRSSLFSYKTHAVQIL